jgi:hypothetical protein
MGVSFFSQTLNEFQKGRLKICTGNIIVWPVFTFQASCANVTTIAYRNVKNLPLNEGQKSRFNF